MKLKFHCFHLLPVLAAGLMISPLSAQSQDRAPEPPRPDAPREAPQPDRLQATIRQMIELKKAGKHEEAQAISQRLRQAANENPQLATQIREAMQAQRQAQPGANTPEPRRPQTRPNAPDQPQPQVRRPNAPDQPQPQVRRPNAPDQPQPQVRRPNAPDQPQPQVRRPNAPDQPQPQVRRPNAPDQPQPQMRRPNAPDQPQPQVRRPNAPDQPQPQVRRPNAPDQPQPPVMRPNAMLRGNNQMIQPNQGPGQSSAMGWQQQLQLPNQNQPMMPPGMGQGRGVQLHLQLQPGMGQGVGREMMQPGMPQGRQNASYGPFQIQVRKPVMQQPYAPQGRGAAMGMRLQFRQRLMQQPYLQHGRNSAMRQFMMQQRGGAQPMMRLNTQAALQCPMMPPQATPTQPQVMRPRVEAAKKLKAAPAQAGEVAKIRHLKQAAEHLAAAGLADHAAMARQMIGRMEADLKHGPTPPAAGKQQMSDKREPKAPHENAKPKTKDRPDPNAAIMGELKKLMSQMGELNNRVRKLEGRDDSNGEKVEKR